MPALHRIPHLGPMSGAALGLLVRQTGRRDAVLDDCDSRSPAPLAP
jgi:hypothetical protein